MRPGYLDLMRMPFATVMRALRAARALIGRGARAGRPLSPIAAGRSPGRSRRADRDKWSGEPGASGHPLMMPDAILAAVADFKNCLERLWPDAARRGISRASFDKFTGGLEPDVKIMDFVDCAAGVHQGVLGLSRSAGDRGAHREGPRAARRQCGGVRCGREGLRRRPLHHRGDLGRRDEIRRRSRASGR